MNKCPRPIDNDDGTAAMCIKNGHCGCDEQDKQENWTMNWIKATDTPPPFGKLIAIVIGAFEAEPKQVREMHICTIIKDSPNDDEEGSRSEYFSFLRGEDEYHDYQFYLVPVENEYIMAIDIAMHGDSDLMCIYSDRISHWSMLPDIFYYDA